MLFASFPCLFWIKALRRKKPRSSISQSEAFHSFTESPTTTRDGEVYFCGGKKPSLITKCLAFQFTPCRHSFADWKSRQWDVFNRICYLQLGFNLKGFEMWSHQYLLHTHSQLKIVLPNIISCSCCLFGRVWCCEYPNIYWKLLFKI